MRPFHCLLASLVLLAGLITAPVRAETYHTCGTIIAALPTVISTQGVYCMNKDLGTAITSGKAIDVQASNVTIDCNGYKIGGLAAGNGSLAVGIDADSSRLNITIRNCGVRGFNEGIYLEGGAGHLVEDNRLDNNLYVGINVQGNHNTVRRNRVYDTGGFTNGFLAYGIAAHANVIDNTVSGVFADQSSPSIYGILMLQANTEARGNEVGGFPISAGTYNGLFANATGIALRNNFVSGTATTSGTGILGFGATDTICSDNVVFKFTTLMNNCQDGGGNSSN